MNGQGPVQSIPLEQQLAKLEPLDTTCPTNRKGIARFSGRDVAVAILKGLPFLLIAAMLTAVTSLFLPPGLAFGLATASYFTAGTIASAAIFCKTLADRKAKAMPADSVRPFINQSSPLPNTSGSSPSPSYPGQTYRLPPANMEQQALPSFPLPNQKPHTPAACEQTPPLKQRSLPAQFDDLPDNQRSQANTNNYPQISGSAATTPGVLPQSDSLPEPVRTYFPSLRGINQPAISHQADIKSEKSVDTSGVKTDKSFEKAIADAILESLLLEIATSTLAETADSISDEASISGDSAFDVSSTSSQSERSFSSDYNSPSPSPSPSTSTSTSTSDGNYQSESEDNDDAPSDLNVNTLATTSISLQGDNRQITSDSVSLRVRAIGQLHDSDDQRERSHPSHSTDGQTDTLTSGIIADEWHPANQSQTSTEQQIAIHNLTQIDDNSFVLEEDIDTALPVESSEPSLAEQSFLPDDNSLATTDSLWQPESDDDNYDASPDSIINTFATTSSALLHDQKEPVIHDIRSLQASTVDQNYDSGDQRELPNLSLSHGAGDQTDILPSSTTEDNGHLSNQAQLPSGQQATTHDLTHFW